MARTNKTIASEDATQRRKTSAQSSSDSSTNPFHGFDSVSTRSTHQRGKVLFVEGQPPLGVYFLCAGRAKISVSSAEGKSLIMRIAHPGEWLGLSCALSGDPHDTRAETLEPCQIDFVSRKDLLKLMEKQTRVSVGIAEALAHEVGECIAQMRLLFASGSAAEKLARLMLKWCRESGVQTPRGTRVLFALTHEELSQMIGASRETVTRLLSEFKRRQLIIVNGSSMLIRKRAALESMVRLG
jgi:CRP/FNR family cyclic AMP-dependent transcriptional regulator